MRIEDRPALIGERGLRLLENGVDRPARSRKKGCERHHGGIVRAAEFHDAVQPHELDPLCDPELLPRARKLRIRKDDRFLLREMKGDPLAAQLGISPEQPQAENGDAEPRPVFRRVEVNFRARPDGKEQQKRSEKERIHKKFAHIRNMGEFSLIM